MEQDDDAELEEMEKMLYRALLQAAEDDAKKKAIEEEVQKLDRRLSTLDPQILRLVTPEGFQSRVDLCEICEEIHMNRSKFPSELINKAKLMYYSVFAWVDLEVYRSWVLSFQ